MKPILIVLYTGLYLSSFGQVQTKLDTISANQAIERIGQNVIVKAKVITTFFGKNISGQPTYLNLDEKFPDNPMTVIISNDKVNEFNFKASDYVGKNIIVRGKMYLIPYENNQKKPCIKIYDKDQIKIVD